MKDTSDSALEPVNVEQAEEQLAFQTESISWYVRVFFGFVGSGLAVLLVTAACLTPSPKGYGTHQQLGLPECSIKMIYDLPCPSCGMTTSWSHMVRGDIISSCKANPGGALLAIISIFLSPWLLISACRGRWFIGVPPDWISISVAISLLLVTLTHWCFQLMY